jgi:hypothetical protein
MIANKRRETEIFSLSFMDCICCGFGAVLLIFILTTGQRVDFSEEDLKDLKKRVDEMEKQVVREKSELDRLAESLSAPVLDLDSILAQNASDKQKAELRKTNLRDLMKQTIDMNTILAQLLKDKERMSTEEEVPLPTPEIDRRQYLTGMKLDGEGAEYVLFVVRASGSMLGESLDDAINRLNDPDFKKREAPKWQRAVKSVEWMIATLAPETKFNILLFNDEPIPLVPDRSDGWIERKDKQLVREAMDRLRQTVPQGSANMERAFTHVRYMPRLPDVIVLLTDGLPTTSETSPATGDADDDDRIRFFRHAQRQLPPRIPVSTILFPMTGDPGAAALYWELAGSTRGALVSPSQSWPDT